MNLTVKAILAKHGFDRDAAIAYCYRIADQYPHLRTEYTALAAALTGHEEKAKATGVGI